MLLPALRHRKLILASSSPRRAELLRAAGFEFAMMSSRVDEAIVPGETARAHVERLARAKAAAVVARLPKQARALVLGADTVVVVDGEILGKPQSREDARRMLSLLSGREHEVVTALALGDLVYGKQMVRQAASRVVFLKLSDAEIEEYLDSGEPFDKAGAYAVQGLAACFVSRIEGSYSNVVGLPISMLYEMLRECEGPAGS